MEINTVPIVGEPMAFGVGVGVLFLVGLATIVGQYPLTLAHEGGHMLAAILPLRRTSDGP